MQMCSLRLQFANLFHDLPLSTQNYCQSLIWQIGAFYFSHACSEDVFNFQTNDSYRFISELSQQALLFLFYPAVILHCDLALACL